MAYEVSEAFNNAAKGLSGGRSPRAYVEIGGVIYDDSASGALMSIDYEFYGDAPAGRFNAAGIIVELMTEMGVQPLWETLEVRAFVGFEGAEYIPVGIFDVVPDGVTYDDTGAVVTLSCIDASGKSDVMYVAPDLVDPTGKTLMEHAAGTFGVELSPDNPPLPFDNVPMTHINMDLNNPTFSTRQLISDYAEINGVNAMIDREGYLRFIDSVGNKYENLLPCDDFSCFIAYNGAQITRSKTFPISVFEGARNYCLDSKSIEIDLGEAFVTRPVDFKLGETITASYDDLEVISGNPFTEEYIVFLLKHKDVSPAKFDTIFIRHDTQMGSVKLTHDVDQAFIYCGSTNITSAGRNGIFKGFKIEKNVVKTTWSPAPEDGYPNGVTPYTGNDPGYHVQSNGGDSIIKVIFNLDGTTRERRYTMDAHNFTEMMVRSANPYPYLEVNKTHRIDYVENSPIGFRIASRTPESNLDFIAANASIDEITGPAFEVTGWDFENLYLESQTIPINSIAVSRAADGDGEDYDVVYARDQASIDRYGLSEFRITNNVFADSMRELVADMLLDKMGGYVYHPFNMEGWWARPDIDPYDLIEIVNSEGDSALTAVSTLQWTYDGGLHGSLETPLIPQTLPDYILAGTDNDISATSIKTDKANKRITASIIDIDKNSEDISELTLEVGKIELTVSTIHNGNIIPNLNGESGYFGWKGNSELIATDDLFADDYLTNTMGFVIKDFDLSLVPSGLSFTNSGSDISPKGSVIPNMEYSYRAKVETFKPFSINVLEYESNEEVDIMDEVWVSDDSNTSIITDVFDNTFIETNSINISFNKENKYFISTDIDLSRQGYNTYEVQFYRNVDEMISYVEFDYETINELTIPNGTTFIIIKSFGNAGYYVDVNNLYTLYEERTEIPIFKTQTFNFNDSLAYVEFTTDLDPQTRFVSLEFVRENVTYLDRLELTEQMFNRGLPKTYFENAEDVRIWAEAQIQVLNNEITLNASQIDAVSGAIHNAGVEINAIEGVTTRGKKFRVLSEDGNTTYLEVDENGLKVEGNITAGSVGDLVLKDGTLTRTFQQETKTYTQADLDRLHQILLHNIIPTEQDYIDYDLNRTGDLNISDYQYIRIIIKEGPNPAIVENTIEVGTNDASLVTSTNINNIERLYSNVEILGNQVTSGTVRTGWIYPTYSFNSSIAISENLISLSSNMYKSSLSLGSGYNEYDDAASLMSSTIVHIYAGVDLLLYAQRDIHLNPGSSNYIRTHGRGIRPDENAYQNLGNATGRWLNIYLQNQPNVASDTRYKLNVQDIDPLLIEIIGREVKPKQYHSKHDDKIHFGYIAQDVERALYKYCGHDKDKYAMLHKDESYMSLLYGELNVIIEAYNRQENEKLQTRIELLEERMNKL